MRSIPAWAGEPSLALVAGAFLWVYPRVGGGTLRTWELPGNYCGLSPRGRGNLLLGFGSPLPNRSIPAWAGEPFNFKFSKARSKVYPRVGGGTSSTHRLPRCPNGLSPRGRGNLVPAMTYPGGSRSIPAWAGEPCTDIRIPLVLRVYPRVGGGTF